MKTYLFLIVVFLLNSSFVINPNSLKNGDIIFQTSKSSQSELIRIATKSPYTHMGIIYKSNGKVFVYEAVGPVKLTPINDWINRGVNKKYMIMRLTKPLTKDQQTTMMNYGKTLLGKGYDIKFQWSNDKLYCSEIVYKLYEKVGIKLCNIKTFSDYNLSSSKVLSEIKKRYGSSFKLNEKVVAPSDIAKSKLLTVISTTY